jgi:hypothetical protein
LGEANEAIITVDIYLVKRIANSAGKRASELKEWAWNSTAFESQGICLVPKPEKNGSAYGQTKKVTLILCSYAQAHLVQQQIAELEKAEKERWIINRDDKIGLALLHLR